LITCFCLGSLLGEWDWGRANPLQFLLKLLR
jgi:hypothetical protein